MTRSVRVLIVAEHASVRWGGEASLPFHYFTRLRERGVEAWLLVHARTREELRETIPHEFHRIHFIEDSVVARALWAVEEALPSKVGEQTVRVGREAVDQLKARAVARELIARHRIDIVHEAAPISPRRPSALHDLGVPVVIGPLCGGMEYPPELRHLESVLARAVERTARRAADHVHRLLPGKLRAQALIVANERTRGALPRGVQGKIYEVNESGVDLRVWSPRAEPRTDDEVRFVFLGRLVDWKGVDLLVDAFATVARDAPMARLEIVGDGPLMPALRTRTLELGLSDAVTFTGWVTRSAGAARLRSADVLVMPSLRECGGTAVLEAMACGLPVVVTDWGGLAGYVDGTCGIKVQPARRDAFVLRLADAMLRLARSEGLRSELSRGALARVREGWLDWDSKVDRILEIYDELLQGRRGPIARLHVKRAA